LAALAPLVTETDMGVAFSEIEITLSANAVMVSVGTVGAESTAVPVVGVAVLELPSESLRTVLNANAPLADALTFTVALPDEFKFPADEPPPAATVPPLTTVQLVAQVRVKEAFGSPLMTTAKPATVFSLIFTNVSAKTAALTTGGSGAWVSVLMGVDAAYERLPTVSVNCTHTTLLLPFAKLVFPAVGTDAL
jgi:hypothetical protein